MKELTQDDLKKLGEVELPMRRLLKLKWTVNLEIPPKEPPSRMYHIGTIKRINEFGLCEVHTEDGTRAVFMLDKLDGYAGQPLKEFGVKVGARVWLEQVNERTTSAELMRG